MLLAWGMDLVYILVAMAWMLFQASAYDCRMGWIENVLFQKNSFFFTNSAVAVKMQPHDQWIAFRVLCVPIHVSPRHEDTCN